MLLAVYQQDENLPTLIYSETKEIATGSIPNVVACTLDIQAPVCDMYNEDRGRCE